jgi:hypothetical protein
MPSGTVEIRLRPLKLAFVVNPADKKALLSAIELNSFLWGGTFNPIIPRFGKIPASWKRRFPNPFTPMDVVRGYISAFDPDIIVTFNDKDANSLGSLNRRVIRETEILDSFSVDHTVKYGIGIQEILSQVSHDEMRFHRKNPITMNFPESRGPLALFGASLFGRLPTDMKSFIDANFTEDCEIHYERATFQNFTQFLEPSNIYLRRISNYQIDSVSYNWRYSNRFLFYLDGLNSLDIVDFWNLRALGVTVIPIPQQASDDLCLQKHVLEFIHKAYFPYRYNTSMFHSATLIPSSCCSSKSCENFIKMLRTKPHTPEGGKPEFSIQGWYPRIWEDWGRQSDGFDCARFRVNEEKHSLQTLEGQVQVPQIEPKFMSQFGGHGTPRFANEIEFHLYGGAELLAEIIPEADDGMARAIGGYGFQNWRFSRSGPVKLASSSDSILSLTCPKAETVFSEWLRSKGWHAALSTPGKIALQMVKQLGGTWGIAVLSNEGLVELLCNIAGNKTVSDLELRKQLNKILQNEKYGGGVDCLLKTLISSKMLSLGLEIQCPTCSIRSWFSMSDIDYKVACPNCYSEMPIPCHKPKEMKWSYQTQGPFNIPKGSYGAYTVLLTLSFFSRVMHGATTPMMSFEATKGSIKLEADLGLFFSESVVGNKPHQVVFAECKTHNDFEKADVAKMTKLSRSFPGALLVFATLKSMLSAGEKGRIREMVLRERKSRLKGKQFSSILILTANELTANTGPTDNWETLSAKHKSLRSVAAHDLSELVDATQQLYLDMDTWYKWEQENRQHRQHTANVRHPKGKTPSASIDASKTKSFLQVTTRLRQVRGPG